MAVRSPGPLDALHDPQSGHSEYDDDQRNVQEPDRPRRQGAISSPRLGHVDDDDNDKICAGEVPTCDPRKEALNSPLPDHDCERIIGSGTADSLTGCGSLPCSTSTALY